jgi:uncharacterized membrane protein
MTWRIFAVLGTIVVALIFTRSIEISLGIGTVEVILKTIMYYLHERAWDRVGLVTETEMSNSSTPQSL